MTDEKEKDQSLRCMSDGADYLREHKSDVSPEIPCYLDLDTPEDLERAKMVLENRKG